MPRLRCRSLCTSSHRRSGRRCPRNRQRQQRSRWSPACCASRTALAPPAASAPLTYCSHSSTSQTLRFAVTLTFNAFLGVHCQLCAPPALLFLPQSSRTAFYSTTVFFAVWLSATFTSRHCVAGVRWRGARQLQACGPDAAPHTAALQLWRRYDAAGGRPPAAGAAQAGAAARLPVMLLCRWDYSAQACGLSDP